MELEGKQLYLVAITGISLVLFVWLRLWLKLVERRRAKRIEKLARFDAINTKAPIHLATVHSRKVALEGLETRFSIVRRTFLTILFMVWAVAAIVPFTGEIPSTLISLSITAGAIIVGIAARPMVENFIAGFVLTFSKQFHTGDTVLLDNEYGTIEDITPTHTVIKLWDWRRYIVPNSGMLSKEVVNFSTRDSFLWAKIEFFVSHDANLEQVKSIAVQLAQQNRNLAGEEAPQFWVMGLDKEAVKCWLAMWAKSPAEAWSIRAEVGQALVKKLNEAGIRTHTHLHSGLPGNL